MRLADSAVIRDKDQLSNAPSKQAEDLQYFNQYMNFQALWLSRLTLTVIENKSARRRAVMTAAFERLVFHSFRPYCLSGSCEAAFDHTLFMLSTAQPHRELPSQDACWLFLSQLNYDRSATVMRRIIPAARIDVIRGSPAGTGRGQAAG